MSAGYCCLAIYSQSNLHSKFICENLFRLLYLYIQFTLSHAVRDLVSSIYYPKYVYLFGLSINRYRRDLYLCIYKCKCFKRNLKRLGFHVGCPIELRAHRLKKKQLRAPLIWWQQLRSRCIQEAACLVWNCFDFYCAVWFIGIICI